MTMVLRRTAWTAAAGIALSLMVVGCGRRGSGVPEKTQNKSDGASEERGSGGWEEVPIGTDAEFSGLSFVDPSVGWMVGGSPFVSGGIVGRTEDGGRTWRYRTGLVPRGPGVLNYSLNAVHGFDRERACVVGDGGQILLTFDGGESWQSARRGPGISGHLFGLHFIDDREGWAASLGGVLHTNDGGMNWTKLGGDSSESGGIGGRAIHFVDRRDGWLAGQHASLWRTRDGGENWARVPVIQPGQRADPLPYLFGMTWADTSRGWIVGEFGTILHTTDAGESWVSQNAGDREAFLTAVQFVDRQTGWIVGFLRSKGQSIVLHTVDAGATWSVQRRLEGEELRALQMIDSETGWAVGDRVRTQPQKMLRRMRRPER